jgi:hypothetical protein
MIVPPEILKSVALVAYRDVEGNYYFAGSVFFWGFVLEGGTCDHVFAVTARHVIEEIRKKGCVEVWLRLNLKNGQSEWCKSDIKEWFVHPTDNTIDIALKEWGLPAQYDHRVIPHVMNVTPETFRSYEVGLGDEVFITGLFKHYTGTQKNIPIVRIGNLACVGEERIQTKDFGAIEGILIEARSIGGLSGSPVFLNLGVSRVIGGEIKISKGPVLLLLGLIHGHYDSREGLSPVALNADEAGGRESINTGIAIVVPVFRLAEVIGAYAKSININFNR